MAETLPRQLARRLLEAVVGGRFAPGQAVPSTAELAKEFGVSRPVVREALGIVAGHGVIENRQGRQARVRERTAWNDLSPEVLSARLATGVLDDILKDCLELRRVIETEAANLAALRASKTEIDAMRGHLERLEACVDDRDAYAIHDVAFHDTVLRATDNRLLLLLVAQMRQLLDVARQVTATSSPSLVPASQAGHRAIFEAMAAGDQDAARSAMQEHLRWAEISNVIDRVLTRQEE